MSIVKEVHVQKMSEMDSSHIERLYYSYNANKDLLGSLLMSGLSLSSSSIQELTTKIESMFEELEKAKESTGRKYIPDHMSLSEVSYSFNFDTNEIEYIEMR